MSAQIVRPMVSRVGREKQVYSKETGARVVAGTVVLNEDKTKILMISATKPGFWVIPKGGVECDESGPEEAAMREAFEEGGVIGKVTSYLGKFVDSRPPKTWKNNSIKAANETWPPRSEFHFYEVQLVSLETEFPEAERRKRIWVDYKQARAELLKHQRFELLWAIDASSIVKNI